MNTNALGFGNAIDEQIDDGNLLQYVSPQDVKSFGIIPELIGRLPVVTHLDPLDREALRNILTEPKIQLSNNTENYSRLMILYSR